MATSSSDLAIVLTLQNVSQVISAIQQITQEFANQHRHVTRNTLAYMALLNESIKLQMDYAKAIADTAKKIDEEAEAERKAAEEAAKKEKAESKAAEKKAAELEQSMEGVLKDLPAAFQNVGKVSSETWGQIGMDINAVIAGGAGGKMGLSGLTSALTAVGNAATQVAGKFQVLNSIGSMLGGVLGAALGGLPGGIGGAAIGGTLGGITGALLNIPNMLLGVMTNVVKIIWNGVSSIISGIGGIGKAIKDLIFGPLSVFGLGVFTSFRNISQGIQQTISDVYEAAQAFQQLRISIETLTQRDIARQMNIPVFEVGIEAARSKTEELFGWLKKVSLTSPFTMESIARSMKFASAMGLSVGATESLTIATGNFAAAMGISEDHQERIMYNLAQIYQQGKLTGREFRDLAISFVPVYDILGEMAKEAGTTTEELKKLALEGGVPVEDFFKHFVDYMDRNYKDAMEKMSRTMLGVKNNIKDFIQVVLGMELLGPLLDKISGKLADVLEVLLSAKTHAIFTSFGVGLAKAFDIVSASINELIGAIGELFKAFGLGIPTLDGVARAFVGIVLNIKYALAFITLVVRKITEGVNKYIMPAISKLGKAQEESGEWGYGLIANFAMGMAAAAGKLLARVIIYIGAIIRAFFHTSSPPKIAPKIDVWGANTINAWIGGMIEGADWKVLKTNVGSNIANVFNPAQDQEVIDTSEGHQRPPRTGKRGRTGAIIPAVEGAADDIANSVNTFIPFITEQGMKLAAAFMSGFDKVDYGVLDIIQNVFKDAQEALIGIEDMGAGDAYKNFYDFSQDLIAAIDEFNKTGKINADIFAQVSEFGMGLGPEMAELIQLEFDYAAAMQNVADSEKLVENAKAAVTAEQKELDEAIKNTEAAQEALDQAIKNTVASRNAVRGLIYEYNALLRGGSDKKTLKNKLSELQAAEAIANQRAKDEKAAEDAVETAKDMEDAQRDDLELAQDQLEIAQDNLDLLKDQADAIQEAADSQNSLIANMIELLRLQNEAREAAAGGGEGFPFEWNVPEEPLDVTDWIPFDWDKMIAEMTPEIERFWNEMMTQFQTSFDTEMISIDTQTAADNFAQSLHDKLTGALGTLFGLFNGEEPIWVQIKNWLFQNWEFVAAAAAGLIIGGPAWAGIFVAILAGAQAYLRENPLVGDLLASLFYLDIFGIGRAIVGMMQTAPPGAIAGRFSGVFTDLWEGFKADFIGSFAKLGDVGRFFVALSNNDIVGAFFAVRDLIGQVFGGGGGGGNLALSSENISDLEGVGATTSETVLSSAQRKAEDWFDENDYTGEITSNVVLKPTDITALETTGKNITDNTLNGAYERITPWFNLPSNNMAFLMNTNLNRQITNETANLKLTGHNVIINTGNGILEEVPVWFNTNDVAEDFKDEINSQIIANASTFEALGGDIVHSIGPGILKEDDWLADKINELIEKAIETYKLKYEKSPIEVFFDLGEDITTSIAAGILKGADYIEKAVSDTTGTSPYSALQKKLGSTKATYIPALRTNAPAVTKNVNVNFGDVYLNSNMDWAVFKSRVHRAITEG